jgi:hypothetical protein
MYPNIYLASMLLYMSLLICLVMMEGKEFWQITQTKDFVIGVKSEIANCQFERIPLQNIQRWHVFVILQIT